MSQTSHLKSAAITALDATPVAIPTSGVGSSTGVRQVDGYAIPLAADAAGSTYQLVRVPSNAIIKKVDFHSQAQGAGAISLSVYYSDSTVDGTPAAVQGLVVPTTGAAFFASQISCSASVPTADYTFQHDTNAGSYTLALRQKRLWDALGLPSDPGGYMDIVAVVDTTAVTTGTGQLGVSVFYSN